VKINFIKCHGSGNDFIMIDETIDENGSIAELFRKDMAIALCDRNSGIGADGILFYLHSESADCRMRMLNPDGGEAEMCGNGLRCIGRYCIEKLRRKKITVETMKAILSVETGEQIYDGIETFKAEIGPISLDPRSLPMEEESDTFIGKPINDLPENLKFTALSVPNPHIITIVDSIDEKTVNQCGIKANNSKNFPKGVNVSFVRLLDKNRIFVITYERGVGITYSCGTAMSASAYVAALNNIVDGNKPISVFNKGGMVVCNVFKDKNNMLLQGNATFVFEASVEMNESFNSVKKQYEGKVRLDEVDAYAKLQEYAISVIEISTPSQLY